MHIRHLLTGISVIALALTSLAQQDKSKRPSPPGTAEVTLKEKKVTIDYSRPSLRGRKAVGGDLVPYGKVWRLGANESTTFVTTADLNVGGTTVPAGAYTIFAIPDKDKWTLIISKKTGEWGTQYPGLSEDLARIDMKVSQLPSPVENFTISFDKSGMGGTLNVDWETTRASVPVAKK